MNLVAVPQRFQSSAVYEVGFQKPTEGAEPSETTEISASWGNDVQLFSPEGRYFYLVSLRDSSEGSLFTPSKSQIRCQVVNWGDQVIYSGKLGDQVESSTSLPSQPEAEATTVYQEKKQESLSTILKDLWLSLTEDAYEYGDDSQFSVNLEGAIRTHGAALVNELETAITEERQPPDIAAEAVRRLGDLGPHSAVFEVLGRCLRSESPVLRDAALLGFSDLDDSKAIPLLREAGETEDNVVLRKGMEQLIRFLAGAGR